MVRKGWRTVEVPNGWLQIIRGPKPPSARWSRTKPSDKPHRAPGVSPDSKQTFTPQVRGPQIPRRTPESNRSAAAAKIARIQASIAALGDEDPEEVELLKKALMKAELQAKIPPLETQIAHAVQFIERAKKRVAGADEKIRKAAEALRQAEAEKVADIQAIAEAEHKWSV